MNRTWKIAFGITLTAGLAFLLPNAPPVNAGPAVQYTLDYARFNEGGVISTASAYAMRDAIKAVGVSSDYQQSASYTVTESGTDDENGSTPGTPSRVKNWKDYQ